MILRLIFLLTFSFTLIVKPASTFAAVEDSGSHPEILKLDYDGFTVWLDCSKHGAVKFEYEAHHDNGSEPRASRFYLDPNVPARCQQTSSKPYGHHYDRGHLVPANHFDGSKISITETNAMTNVLPQAANMNRGAWLKTEEIIECYRDIEDLTVIGGVIWGDDPSDDYFTESHSIKTPDAFWKVVIKNNEKDRNSVIAWIVPNSQEAKRSALDSYLTTVDYIEHATGEKIPIDESMKHHKPSTSWILPKGCNKN